MQSLLGLWYDMLEQLHSGLPLRIGAPVVPIGEV